MEVFKFSIGLFCVVTVLEQPQKSPQYNKIGFTMLSNNFKDSFGWCALGGVLDCSKLFELFYVDQLNPL